MERYEIAARVWSMLTEAAKSRKVLYYSDIDSSNPQMVGKLYLEPIQSYCLLEDLPALTVLVVGRATGRPGIVLDLLQITSLNSRRHYQTIRSTEERSYLLRRRVLSRFSAKSPTLRFGAKQ